VNQWSNSSVWCNNIYVQLHAPNPGKVHNYNYNFNAFSVYNKIVHFQNLSDQKQFKKQFEILHYNKELFLICKMLLFMSV